MAYFPTVKTTDISIIVDPAETQGLSSITKKNSGGDEL